MASPANAPSTGRRLALGTVQFGLKYGIADPERQIPAAEACALLRLAHARGIAMLDTAPVYGESEAVVGRCLASRKDHFDIVTKTLPFAPGGAAHVAAVAREFSASLARLGRESLYGVLVHHAGDLLSDAGEELYEQLAEWRARGLTRKIGVSVYSRAEVDKIFGRYRFDLVQLPVSVFDQRLVVDGTLGELKRMGVEVHARSVFLQGLLLMEPAALPAGFESAAPLLQRLRAALGQRGLSALAGALAYVAGRPEIDRIVIGVHSAAQLLECLAAFERPASGLDFSAFACHDDGVLDPRRWAPMTP